MARKQGGFTLIEVLLVIGIIAILASIVIIAINPSRQLAQSRNTQRRSDVNTILNALYQYSIDNDGDLPSGIPSSSTCNAVTQEICDNDTSCTSLTDLGDLIDDERYLVTIPTDPTGASGNAAGYAVVQTTNNRLIVCAPDAELSETIEVTR